MGFPQLRAAKPFKFREPTAYTLTADAGTYDITGSTAGLLSARKLTPVEAGSYAVSGTDATLAQGGRLIAADAGSYTLSGTDADLTAQVIPPSLSFTDLKRKNYPRAFHPSLRKPMRFAVPIVNYTLTADSGTYATTGSSAGLIVAYKIAADASSYAISGADATLFSGAAPSNFLSTTQLKRNNYPRAFHPSLRKPIRVAIVAAQDYIIAANPGSYEIGGEAASLNASHSQVSIRVKARNTWPRQFAPTVFGQLVSKRRAPIGMQPSQNYIIAASAGAYAYTGALATLRPNRVVSATSGSYALTGTDAGLAKGLLAAQNGSYTITGTSASLEISHKLVAGSGSYTISGTDAATNRGFHVDAASGSYVISGTDTETAQTFVLSADAGSYALTGASITVITDATIPIGTVLEANVSVAITLTQPVSVQTTLEAGVKI